MKLSILSNRVTVQDIVDRLNLRFRGQEDMEQRLSVYMIEIAEELGLRFEETENDLILSELMIANPSKYCQ